MKTSLEPSIPLLDLGAVHGPLQEELLRDFERVLRSGQFILGPEHDAFEVELGEAHIALHDDRRRPLAQLTPPADEFAEEPRELVLPL